MWIFTKFGFFSAVCARQGEGQYYQPVDPDRIMVRGRLRSHLNAIKKRFPDLLGDSEIKEFPGADYAYWFFVPKLAWVRVFAGLSEETVECGKVVWSKPLDRISTCNNVTYDSGH